MLLKLKTRILWTQNKGSGNISDKLFTSNLSPLLPHQRFAQTLPTNPALPSWLQTRQRRLKMSELLHLCSVTKFTCRRRHCRFSISFPSEGLFNRHINRHLGSSDLFFFFSCSAAPDSTYPHPTLRPRRLQSVHWFIAQTSMSPKGRLVLTPVISDL